MNDDKAAPESPLVSDIWGRIREHKVVQWGLAYLGVALALAHGEDLVAHAFDWPEFIARILMSLLVLGFPIALTVAWYHGHRGAKRLTAGEGMIIALLLLIGAGLLTVLVRVPEKSEAVAAQQMAAVSAPVKVITENTHAIAVLPFENMSGDAGQDYFCDGISEEIMDALVRLPGMQVIGRTSSFAFKGQNVDLRTIGQKLGVANLVQGSVRREGNRVRIDVQLVHASDGVEVWSQSFDRNLSDILKVQEDIARTIAEKLSGGAANVAQDVAATTNGPAYGKYLEGKTLFNKGDFDSIESGIKALEEAVTLDPNLAPAWAELAHAYSYQYGYNKSITFAQTKVRVETARSRALQLDPKSVLALLAIPGLIDKNNDWIEYDPLARRVLAANPDNIDAMSQYAEMMFFGGHVRAALPYYTRLAREFDPLSSERNTAYGYSLYITGQRAQGKALIDKALTLNPMDLVPRSIREEISLGEGNIAAAVADQRFLLKYGAYNDAERQFGEHMMTLALAGDKKGLRDLIARNLAAAHAGTVRTDWLDFDRWAMAAGDPKLAVDAMLEEDSRPESRFTFLWRWAPLFAPARAQPGFKTLVERHKLPAYWRADGWPDFCGPVGPSDFECH